MIMLLLLLLITILTAGFAAVLPKGGVHPEGSITAISPLLLPAGDVAGNNHLYVAATCNYTIH
ncbi:hypothetical protein BU23DRAFT_262436 [Bimuria novae-zelandiae CBS 107.79]|uniref:Uncharacterized protein n=1 Tax=Bimuria novae-zelandiae CBS 107.79 TaxID=1447943 RepID=A0A6A5UVJ7_9PLEO|nr:hypothetical protein BU23DRAFT_262436 [Bimuria novae-zelandiae CBS 107.79]